MNNTVKNRWWRTSYDKICVQVDEKSPALVVLKKKLTLKKVSPNTFIFKPPKNTEVDKIFNSLNKIIRTNSTMKKAGVEEFRKKQYGISRSFEELQHMSLKDFSAIKNFKKPRNIKKKINPIEELKKIGIESVYDVLFYLPRRYIDRTNPIEDFSNMVDENVIIVGTITNIYTAAGRIPRTIITVKLKTKSIDVVFFRQPWLSKIYREGNSIIISGKYNIYRGKGQISGSTIDKNEATSKPVVPIYSQLPRKGLSTNFFESLIDEALAEAGTVRTPSYMKGEIGSNLASIMQKVHSPQTMSEMEKAYEDMALYELTLLQSMFAKQSIKDQEQGGKNTVISKSNKDKPLLQTMLSKHMPFNLTDDQKKGVQIVVKEMSTGHASNVLLSADVGAGKTIIAQLAALRAVEAGHQAAIAAPTSVLAKQLYDKTADLFSCFPDIKVVYLSGNMKAAERRELETQIKNGEADIIVGTHVVLSNPDLYKSLAFVCIDEQHKFGAQQRTAINKALSSTHDGSPVIMQQTATPIPRSMAQTMFGGMTMIRLQQKPSGRLPIKTTWVKDTAKEIFDDKEHPLWKKMNNELSKGNQAFVIAPFVTDSSFMEDVSSVETLYKDINKLFPKLRVAMIHGKMKTDDIDEVMEEVRAKKFDVVVASTVVEVGVDIPDATFISIFSADRLGIASLHQLRGRVGRNSKQSYCALVANGESEMSAKRLIAMENSNDGFELAEEDLKNRGAGHLLGTKQHGDSEMHFAVNALTPEILEKANNLAQLSVKNNTIDNAIEDAKVYFGQDVILSSEATVLI